MDTTLREEGRPYLTVALHNIPTSITLGNVEENFNRILVRNCQPIVHPLLQIGSALTTTVTFLLLNKSEEIAALEKLRRGPFLDRHGKPYEIVIDSAFRGLTLLYSCPSPQFDFYFIHGLDGHGYKTWLHRAQSHRHSFMWPRDGLPLFLKQPQLSQNEPESGPASSSGFPSNSGHNGRYFSFGYNADTFGKKNMSQSIEATAWYLLQCLDSEDFMLDDKPKFFVCHSLGGLIVSHAMTLILCDESEIGSGIRVPTPVLKQRYFHSRTGECLVKGIFFFGTPFGGSWLANYASPAARLIRQNSSFTDSLIPDNPGVARTKTLFIEARKKKGCEIPLFIFHEELKMGKGMLNVAVTTRKSALQGFHGDVRDCPLPRDHSQMVKYSGINDPDFFKFVGPNIRSVVGTSMFKFAVALQGSENVFAGLPRSKENSLQNTGPVTKVTMAFGGQHHHRWMTKATIQDMTSHEQRKQREEGRMEAMQDNELALSTFEWQNKEVFNEILGALMSGIENEILHQTLSNQLMDVEDPIRDTCDGIPDENFYRDWESSETSRMLFIEGKEGLGKSVIAKYLVQRLKKKFPSATVAFFFCKGIQDQDKATMIFRRLILQIEDQQPGIIRKAVKGRNFTSLVRKSDFDVLWNLFRAIMQETQRRIFCVIDGIDELLSSATENVSGLDQFGGTGGVSEAATFLRQLCEYFVTDERDISQNTVNSVRSGTAVLFTTRPVETVTVALGEKALSLVMKLDLEEVRTRAKTMIEEEIQALVRDLELGPELEALIRRVLFLNTEQSTSPFQWARTALQKLQSEGTCSPDSIQDRLAELRPEIYSLYQNSLDLIIRDENLSRMASALFTILITVQGEVKFDAMCEILCPGLSADPDLWEDIRPGKIRSTIEACRGLVRLTPTQVLVFNHPTVKEFLQQLSPSNYPTFSARDEEQHHYRMTMMCLRYLNSWIKRPFPYSSEDGRSHLDSSMRDVITYWRFVKSTSVFYAWNQWPYHARGCGELIKNRPMMALLRRFLNPKAPPYRLTAVLIAMYEDENLEPFDAKDWTPPSPADILARSDLIHLLEMVPLTAATKTRVSIKRFLGIQKSAPAFPFSLDLNTPDSYGSTSLHHAAGNGATKATVHLLSQGAMGEVFNNDGETPFSLAVSAGHKEVANILIARDEAFERAFDPKHITSLHYACAKSWENIVRYLLKKGTDVNYAVLDNKWTPLHVAAEQEQEDIVGLLLGHGANVEAVLKDGRTALHVAASNGHLGVVKMLLTTSPGMKPSPRNKDGVTPLSLAAKFGHIETFAYLQERATSVNPDDHGWLPIHHAAFNGHTKIVDLIPSKGNLEATDKYKRRPIHLAAEWGHLEVVQSLIRRGADPIPMAIDRFSPADAPSMTEIPIASALRTGHLHVVRYLLEQKFDLLHWKNSYGGTFLHEVAEFGEIDIVQTLVERFHFEPFERDALRETPLHRAARSRQKEPLEYLWRLNRHGAMDIEDKDIEGETMLFDAIRSGRIKNVRFLLDQGADPNAVNVAGEHAISLAVTEDVQTLDLLIQQGAKPNVAPTSWDTPLNKAAKMGYKAAMEMLLDEGADTEITNCYGITPIQEAAARHHEEIFLRLLQLHADPQRLNGLGMNALDYASQSALLRESPRIKEVLAGYNPPSREARMMASKSRIIPHLYRYKTVGLPNPTNWASRPWMVQLGWFLWPFGMQAESITCYEILIKKHANERCSVPLRCEHCNSEGWGPFPYWRCRTCAVSVLCNPCYEKRQNGDIARGCDADHELLPIGGEKWRCLKPGTVDSSGRTVEEFINHIMETFGVDLSSPSSDTQTSTGTTTKEPSSPDGEILTRPSPEIIVTLGDQVPQM